MCLYAVYSVLYGSSPGLGQRGAWSVLSGSWVPDSNLDYPVENVSECRWVNRQRVFVPILGIVVCHGSA